MITINGENRIFGRLCSYVAKKLLDTKEQVVILNSEKVVISGDKKEILARYLEKKDRGGKGNPLKNPKYPRYPDRLVKRCVRGMLPRNAKGSFALKRLKVYINVPDKYEKEVPEAVKAQHIKQITLLELSKKLGANLK